MYSSEFLNGLWQNSLYFNGVPCFTMENQQFQNTYFYINSLIFKNQQLQKQVSQLQATIAALKNQNQAQKIALSQAKNQKQGEIPKRKFRKNHICLKQGCGRKYSSRIALNRHLRQKNHRTY